MQNSNPLFKHFRQPAIFLKLPSGGKYWTPNSLSLPASGEVGVMPMTAKDEVMLRTPDALMNGQGVVSVVESCVPAITNAWGCPTIDIDAILIAIRIATYGDDMDIDSKCPNCDNENRHQMSLGPLLMKVKSPDYSTSIEIEGLIFKFKPQNYLQSNKSNLIDFEEQKIMQLVGDETIDDETRKAQFDLHLQNVVDIGNTLISNQTESITTEEGIVVTDSNHIREFYKNTTNKIIKLVQNKIAEINSVMSIQPAHVFCEACEKEYDVKIEFDYGNFFEPLS